MNATLPDNPLLAVSHADPYPYYAELLLRPGPWFDTAIGMWVVARAKHVEALLHAQAARVRPIDEPIPNAILGSDAGALFGWFARMNDGPRHQELRALAERHIRELESSMPGGSSHTEIFAGDDVNEFIERFAVIELATGQGFDPADVPGIVRSVRTFVRGIAPSADAEGRDAAAAAATHLLASFRFLYPTDGAEAVANRIGLLFQSFDATRGLIGNALVALARGSRSTIEELLLETLRDDPPVQNTRRYLAADLTIEDVRMHAGESVLLLFAAANRDKEGCTLTFGDGRHGCPGQRLALSTAAAGVRAVLASGIDVAHRCRPIGYVASPNVRIPLFA